MIQTARVSTIADGVLGMRKFASKWSAGCFFVLFLCSAHAIGAEPPIEYLQRTWTRDHGLPDNLVHAVLQTRDGYLWVGTRSGLARFDGLRFTVFDHLNTPAMQSDLCQRLAEDSEGNLWIGTPDGLLCKTDDAFLRFSSPDGLPDASVTALYTTS